MRPEARPAAAWWASRLGRCHHVSGSMRNAAEMSWNITMNLEPQGSYDDDQRDRFCAELEQLIDVLQPRPRHLPQIPTVKVDYDPDETLTEAARRAGLDLGRHDLPVKTWMRIEPGKITVMEGYGAAVLVIWRDGELTMDAAVKGIDTIP